MSELAVIVGRFQVHYLTAGHIDLINKVLDINENLLILLGTSPTRCTGDNPLTFEMREQMIRRAFPTSQIIIKQLNDVGSDIKWSAQLDNIVCETLIQVGLAGATLYGSRDSFIQYYKGDFNTQELPHRFTESGTALRQAVSKTESFSEDFRAGIIYAANYKFPTTFPTVDIAIMDKGVTPFRFLMGRKPNETKFRFIGGFAEPISDCYEDDAYREVQEETGLLVDNIRYIHSKKMDDWRYRRSADKIKTLFFISEYIGGEPKPNDDIAEIKWFELRNLTSTNIVDTHLPLCTLLMNYLLNNYY